MAAGMGSRYGGLKQLDGFWPNGEIIMEYSIYDAIQAGFEKVVFVIREDFSSEFKEKIWNKLTGKIEIAYAYQSLQNIPSPFQVPTERTKPRGTGQAVLAAKDYVDGPFAVINADDFYGREGFLQLAEALKKNTDLNKHFIMGYYLKNVLSDFGTVSRGICQIDQNNDLISINERKKIQKNGNDIVYIENDQEFLLWEDDLASMNLFWFSPSLRNILEKEFETFLKKEWNELSSEFLMPEVLGTIIQTNQWTAEVIATNSNRFGVTYPEDKPEVSEKLNTLIQNRVYPNQLWE